jgi:hypothetical protein
MTVRALALTVAATALLSCGQVEKMVGRATGGAGPLVSGAKTHCYGWPERQFDRENRAKVSTWLKAGQKGVDVTLRTTDGGKTTLGALLAKGKPLLLVTASQTCPVFQEKHPQLGETIRKYQDRVTFASVYLIEAHPSSPDPGPYKGKVSIHEYSDRRQAMTLEQRLANAREVKTYGSEIMLVDDLSPGNENPFWCTWGTCANCAYLVATDGTLAAVHEWYDPASMEGSIQALVGP